MLLDPARLEVKTTFFRGREGGVRVAEIFPLFDTLLD